MRFSRSPSARFDAQAREYHYHLCVDSTSPIFMKDFSWFVPGGLDHRCVVGKFHTVSGVIGPAQDVGTEDLRGLYDAQAAAIDNVRRDISRGVGLPVRFAKRVDGLYDRNRRPVLCGGFGHTADHRGGSQWTYAVLHGNQTGIGGECRQPVLHRVEPLGASCGDFVFRHVETCCEVLPKVDMLFGEHHHDLCPGQCRGEIVDRARQYGHAAQKLELLGPCAACAMSAASCYDDDSRAFHWLIVLRVFVRLLRAVRANRAA